MANPLDITIDLLRYTGTSTNDPADATKIKSRIQESTTTAFSRQQLVVEDEAADQEVALIDASTDYVMIFTDRAISIKINGIATAITLTPQAAGTKCFVYYWRGTITSLTISNSSGSDANVDVISVKK